MKKRHAPFSDETVLEILAFQRDGRYGPFVCPNSHIFDAYEDYQYDREEISAILFDLRWTTHKPRLLPSQEGLVCLYEACGYTKNWVWEYVADGSWRSAERSTPLKRSG